jgi:hypothetical protein
MEFQSKLSGINVIKNCFTVDFWVKFAKHFNFYDWQGLGHFYQSLAVQAIGI